MLVRNRENADNSTSALPLMRALVNTHSIENSWTVRSRRDHSAVHFYTSMLLLWDAFSPRLPGKMQLTL